MTLRLHTANLLQPMRSNEYASPISCRARLCSARYLPKITIFRLALEFSKSVLKYTLCNAALNYSRAMFSKSAWTLTFAYLGCEYSS